jgi:hypothetical protein
LAAKLGEFGSRFVISFPGQSILLPSLLDTREMKSPTSLWIQYAHGLRMAVGDRLKSGQEVATQRMRYHRSAQDFQSLECLRFRITQASTLLKSPSANDKQVQVVGTGILMRRCVQCDRSCSSLAVFNVGLWRGILHPLADKAPVLQLLAWSISPGLPRSPSVTDRVGDMPGAPAALNLGSCKVGICKLV